MDSEQHLKAAKQIAMWCDINLVLSCYTAVRCLPPDEVHMVLGICRGRLESQGFDPADIDEALGIFRLVGQNVVGRA